MSFISVVAVLAFERLYAFPRRNYFDQLFFRYVKRLERFFNAVEPRQGAVIWFAGVLLPVTLAAIVYYVLVHLSPILAWMWNVVILYFTMGFRLFGHSPTVIAQALREGDLETARELLAKWSGQNTFELNEKEILRLAIEHGFLSSYCHVFGVVAWFFVLPGPIGAVLYHCSAQLCKYWGNKAHEKSGYSCVFATRLFEFIDWIPARASAISFAIVGNFEDAIFCWRAQAHEWLNHSHGVILSSAAGALDIQLGGDVHQQGGVVSRPKLGLGDEPDISHLESAAGLVWRALVLWLTLILLSSIAAWMAN